MAARWVSVTSAQSGDAGDSANDRVAHLPPCARRCRRWGRTPSRWRCRCRGRCRSRPPRPVTVRVKVSSVPAVSAGIVDHRRGARGVVKRHRRPARRSGQRPGIGHIRAPRPAIAAAAVERHRAPGDGNLSVIGQGIRGRARRAPPDCSSSDRLVSAVIAPRTRRREAWSESCCPAAAASARSVRRTPRREAWTESCGSDSANSARSARRTPRREAWSES